MKQTESNQHWEENPEYETATHDIIFAFMLDAHNPLLPFPEAHPEADHETS